MGRVLGIGTDVLEISRIEAALERHGDRFVSRVFTPREEAYCRARAEPASHFAGRFAAKEAVLKALGCGFGRGVLLTDVEVVSDGGEPRVSLAGAAARLAEEAGVRLPVLLSISHSRHTAVAFALMQG